MDKLITTIDKPAEMDLKISQIITLTEKNHSKLANLDYESSGHTGFASQKDLEEVMSVASGKSRSFTVQSVQDLGTLFGIEITSSEEEYAVSKSQIVYKGENVNLQNGYVFYIVDDGPDYWFSKDNMKLYATEGLGGGIPILVGTDSEPINPATLDKAKLYILLGTIGTANQINLYNYAIGFVMADNRLALLLHNTSSQGVCYSAQVQFNNGGEITLITKFTGVRTLNGLNNVKDIYAPISSGTQGQILQSEGEKKAPTWVDPSELGLATLDDVTNAINGAWEDSY